MASAWGASFGKAFGNAWGLIAVAPDEEIVSPGSFYSVAGRERGGKRRRLYDINIEIARTRRRLEDDLITFIL